jgi:hypothetical protein
VRVMLWCSGWPDLVGAGDDGVCTRHFLL